MYQKNRGITIVALVITIIIMLILVGVSITIGTNVINKSQQEDIKTNMLSIQGKAMTIGEKNSFDPDNNSLVGTRITDKSTLSNGLQNELNSSDAYYQWSSDDLNNQGLGTIKTSSSEFYIVDYNNNEVFYSLGVNVNGTTYYSLSDLKDQ